MLDEVNDDTFEEMVVEGSRDKTVVVDYYSNSCAPCNRLMPRLEDVNSSLTDDIKIVKVNTDSNFMSTLKNKVKMIPTLIVYKNGEVVKEARGCSTMSNEEINSFINV